MKKRKARGVIINLIVWLLCLVHFYPFFYMLINTFKTRQDGAFNPMGLPKVWVLDNYVEVFTTVPVFRSFFNTLLITVCSVLLFILFGTMAAYPVVYNKNKFNKVVMIYLLLGFMIPFQSILIPLFQTMTNMGLINKLIGLVCFYTAGCSMTFFLTMGYMKGISFELNEAALIDGCSIFGIYWRIILPLLKPVIATAAIFHSMAIWNDFLAPLMFLNSADKATLVLQAYRAKSQFGVNWPMFMTFTVIVLIPALVFFLVMQKNILKGLSAGAVKG